MGKTVDAKILDCWRLRPAACDDVTGLHDLASMPMVYRYLFDGEAPDRELIVNRIARGTENIENTGRASVRAIRRMRRVAAVSFTSHRRDHLPVESSVLGARSCCENGMDSDQAHLWLVANQRRCGRRRSSQYTFAGRDTPPRDGVSPERPVPTRSRL
jgi:hypothetical protein